MVEQVFDAETEAVEVALRGARQVGAISAVAIVLDSVIAEQCREIAGKPIAEVVGHMSNQSIFLGFSFACLDPDILFEGLGSVFGALLV